MGHACGQPTVDNELGPGRVAGLVTGKEQNEFRDFDGLCASAKWYLQRAGVDVLGHRRVGESRVYRADANAEVGHVEGNRFREPAHAERGSDVGMQSGAAAQAGLRSRFRGLT